MNLKLISGVTLITLLSTVSEANEGVIRANSLTYPGSIMSIMNSVEPKKRICKSCGQQRIKHLDYQPVTPPRQKNKSKYFENLTKAPYFDNNLLSEHKVKLCPMNESTTSRNDSLFRLSHSQYNDVALASNNISLQKKLYLSLKHSTDMSRHYPKLEPVELMSASILSTNEFIDCADINLNRTNTFFRRYIGIPYSETINFHKFVININNPDSSIEFEHKSSCSECTQCKQNSAEQ